MHASYQLRPAPDNQEVAMLRNDWIQLDRHRA
jgi:hypothetical protein